MAESPEISFTSMHYIDKKLLKNVSIGIDGYNNFLLLSPTGTGYGKIVLLLNDVNGVELMFANSAAIGAESYAAPGFEKVLEVFKQNLRDGTEKGGSYAAYYKGDLVVNAWGGLMDPEKKTPWKKDTLSVYWSSTKGVSAIVVGHLVDRGHLNYSDKISKHWPEFAQKGKEDVTVAQLLTHSTGLLNLDGKWALKDYHDDYPQFEKKLAEQEPYWKPGTNNEFGYHAVTFGLYIDPLVRRVDPKKRSLSQYFDEEFAKPLGLDFYIGLPEKMFDRAAMLAFLEENIDLEAVVKEVFSKANPEYLQRSQAEGSPTDMLDITGPMNTKEIRAIPCGSTHGSGTAESLAKLYGVLANDGLYNGKQVLSAKTISALEEPAMTSVDQILGSKLSRGMGTGLMQVVINDKFDKPFQLFGHPGAGGQFAYGDRSAKLGFAYTSNYMSMDPRTLEEMSPRLSSLLYATYDCVNALEGKSLNRKVYMCLDRLEKDQKEKIISCNEHI